jgi:transmembrane 9 superfamily member 3
VQLALLVVLVVLITIAGTLFEERGVILTMIILVYALTSVVGGYASGSHYSRSDGKVQNCCSGKKISVH